MTWSSAPMRAHAKLLMNHVLATAHVPIQSYLAAVYVVRDMGAMNKG
jgi:hypothetical protein